MASVYFHASDTILGELLDLGGMFLFVLTVAALQQRRAVRTQGVATGPQQHPGHHPRLRFGSNQQLISLVIARNIGLAAASLCTGALASPMFGLIGSLVAVHEVWSGYMTVRYGKALVITFLVAWGVWWLDYLGIWCCPSNHVLTGHGIWHLLNGLVFWFTFLHFRP